MALVMVYKTPSATPTFTAGATISGTLEAANVLTCSYTVTGSNGEVVRWYRHTANDGSDPTGVLIGEGLTYLLTSNENGFYIRVIVTATNAAGLETNTSAYTGQVTAPPPPVPPSFTSPVTISGTATVGSTLTVQFTPSGHSEITITWTSYTTEDKQGPATLGTGAEYTLQPAEAGRWIGVRVLLANAIGQTLGEDLVPMSGADPFEPELPNEYIPPAYNTTGMNMVYCNAGDNLQTKLDSLVPGDCLVIQSGVTWNGPIQIRHTVATGVDNKWIYVISDDMTNVAAPGTRVAPSHTGITANFTTGVFTSAGHGFSEGQKILFSMLNGGPELAVGRYYYARDVTTNTFKVYAAAAGGSPVAFSTNVVDGDIMLAAASMPRILSPNGVNGNQNAIRIDSGARKVRICGLHVQLGYTGTAYKYAILQVPTPSNAGGSGTGYAEDIVFDRCYISGNRTTIFRDCVVTYGVERFALINSHLCEAHGTDESHGIQCYFGGKRLTIQNNRIEASGINCFVGDNPWSSGTPPIVEDVVIRGNYLYKPTRWWVDGPDYEGTAWESKNNFETKASLRLLFEGNVMHNSWVKTQHGNSFLLTPRGREVVDTTIRYNVSYRTWTGCNLNSADVYILRAKIENNVFCMLRNTGLSQGMLIAAGYAGAVDRLTIKNNTLVGGLSLAGGSFIFFNGNANQVGFVTNLRITNNIFDQMRYALGGNGVGAGPTALNYYASNWLVDRNGAFRSVAGQPSPSQANWTNWIYSGSSVTSVKFADDNLATLEGFALLPTSPFYKNDAQNNDRGANIPALIGAINDRVI